MKNREIDPYLGNSGMEKLMEKENLSNIASTQLLKATDVAEILNISRAFAYQLMRKGGIRTVKIMGARRVRPEDLQLFIEANTSSL